MSCRVASCDCDCDVEYCSDCGGFRDSCRDSHPRSSARLSANRGSYIKTTSLWSGLKELYYLRNLDHPNIVKAKTVRFYWGGVTDETDDSISTISPPVPTHLEFTEPVYTDLTVYIQSYQVDRQLTRRIVCDDLVSVLEYLAGKGINHNDIKPDNIVVEVLGGADLGGRGDHPDQPNQPRPFRTVLIDFGSATIRSEFSWTQAVNLAVSRVTAAPEFLVYYPGQPNATSDLFALAATLIVLNRGTFYLSGVPAQCLEYVKTQGYLPLLKDDPLAERIKPWLAYEPSQRVIPWLEAGVKPQPEPQLAGNFLVTNAVNIVTKHLKLGFVKDPVELPQRNQLMYYLTAAYLLSLNLFGLVDLDQSLVQSHQAQSTQTLLSSEFLTALQDLVESLDYNLVTVVTTTTV